jgi:hypothetical protein
MVNREERLTFNDAESVGILLAVWEWARGGEGNGHG